MWTLAFPVVLMLRGLHPLQSPGRFTFQHRIPDHPSKAIFPGRKSGLRGVCVWVCGGTQPLLPGVAALLTLAWLEQEEMPGLAG